MVEINFITILSQFCKTGLSLDFFYPRNIFIFSSDFFALSFEEDLQMLCEFVTLFIHQILVAIVLLTILVGLLRNMFEFSFRNFMVHWVFDFQCIPFYNTDYPVWQWSELGTKFFRDRRYNWWVNLAYFAADNLLIILFGVFTLVLFNSLVYYNYINVGIPGVCMTANLNFNFIKWITFKYSYIFFGFIIDSLSLLMLVVVLTISTLVHYYSIDYMANDPWLLTFLKYLSGFTLAMVVLITANNFALLFMGWEGVGIFSYLLIGFWYTWTLALKASLKAVIVNRIGDVALIIASGLVLHFFGTIDFVNLSFLLNYIAENKLVLVGLNFSYFDVSLVTLICFFLLIAAVGKSAQFGLHTWLPDAMEGPTPVSALIHAATMVTAGVYLIVWTSFIFEQSEIVRNLTLILGAFTALFGSITACYQHDIKWIIAFSTCSQLGYMFLACGLSAYNLAMFHLFIHAFFKALLFLCAGSVIHSIGDEQDIWKMGGLLHYLPITYIGLCIGFFSLAGLPFTSGFFSKDTIIELALTKRTTPALYAYVCGSLGAWFTAFYSFRFFYFVVFWETRIARSILINAYEHGINMLNVLAILAVTTIFIGGITKNPLTTPFSFIFFSDSILVQNYNFYFSFYEFFIDFYEVVHEYVFNYLKWILLFIPIFGAYTSLCYYWYATPYPWIDVLFDAARQYDDKKNYSDVNFGEYTDEAFNKFFEFKGTTDEIYNRWIVKPVISFSYQISYQFLDWGWLEFFFIKLPSLFCLFFSKILNQNFGTLRMNFLPALFFIAVCLAAIFLLIFY